MLESKDYYIDLINSSKANKMTAQYHYSGVGFKKAILNQGIYRKSDNLLVGVLQWGCSYQEGIRLDRYVTDNITKNEYLELNRFSMADSEGKNAESQAISLGIKWIKQNRPDIRLLVSYAGRKEGNYGYIYQATNWEYLGYFISNGFWFVDGEERHLATLWRRYERHGDTSLPFYDALCKMYHDVRETKTKQFIYIQRLDKKLHLASPVLPYPKPSNEYPIMTEMRILQRNDEYFENYQVEQKEKIFYYYEKDEQLFSRQALQRRAMKEEGIEREKVFRPYVAVYDRHGDFVDWAETITDLCRNYPEFVVGGVSTAIKNNKIYKNHFFINYSKFSEPPETIEIDYIAEIDGVKFIKQVEIANYLGISRQAVSAAYKRKAETLGGRDVKWQ
jgi:hypothetical protein